MRPPLHPREPQAPQRRSANRTWLWALTGVSVFALALLAFLFVFRVTSISVVPQSQPVTFDDSAQFTAYPQATAAGGTLPYTVQSTDLEDSEVVPSTGTTHVSSKASGTITVVNNYSASPVKFVKNTRFQSQGGLIFRVLSDISIPGKTASGPGKVSVTVAADAPGEQYNIGPQSRFTVPGLKSSPAEYAQVYASSATAMSGGFSGDQPGVAPSDLDAARSKVRARLQGKATAFENAQSSDTATVLGQKVTFTDMPNTAEAGQTVRIHETAHVDVAVTPSSTFASIVSQSVAANAPEGSVRLVPKEGFAITPKDTSVSWGAGPLEFALSGHAQIVWIVDVAALSKALAGRDAGAFQTIVSNFPGVESAHARIEPFWEGKFPKEAADIHIKVEAPKAQK